MVPAALVDACEVAPVLTEREAVLDLCARVWVGGEPSRAGLERGEARVTHGQLADAWGWSRHKVRSFLRKLESTNEISTLGEGRATLIRLTQLRRNLDATLTQPRRKRTEEIQGVTTQHGATLTQPRRNGDATLTHYIERDKEQETRDPALRSSSACDAEAAPPGDEGAGEPVEVAPDLSTKAGRGRAYPPLSAVPKRGPRYEWPQAFAAFLAAYPNRTRAPGPATYTNWRKLVVDGVEPATLQRAVELYADTALAKSPAGEYVRRAHGPSGWLAAGEWEIYATDAEEVARAAEPREYAAPVAVAPLSSFGCAEWDALEAGLRAQLGASYPPSLAACVGRVVGGVVELHTRDEMAALAAQKHAPALLRMPVDVKLHGV